MKFPLAALAVLSLVAPLPVRAERLQVCHAYDCASRTEIQFGEVELKGVQSLFRGLKDAEAERDAAARAVGMFYLLAGTQSPIWQDHGENNDDEEVVGRMDCIDHSINTTEFLLLMQRRGWLRFHEVAEPVRRGFWNAHWGAKLIERATRRQFVVDSWFYDPGEPAVVFALETWSSGARPPEPGKHAPW